MYTVSHPQSDLRTFTPKIQQSNTISCLAGGEGRGDNTANFCSAPTLTGCPEKRGQLRECAAMFREQVGALGPAQVKSVLQNSQAPRATLLMEHLRTADGECEGGLCPRRNEKKS